MPELPDAVASFRLLLVVAQQLRYLFDRRLEPDGLTTAQAVVLSVIEASEHAPSYSTIAEVTATTHQNVAKIVENLERKGFVLVTADAHDRRIKRVSVTESSRRYWASRDRSDFEAVRAMFASLSDEDLAHLRMHLETLQRGTDARYWDAVIGRSRARNAAPQT
jgi:DNA-binding MarR family transcriptional regulator